MRTAPGIFVLACLALGPVRAEVLDRVAVSVANAVITQRDILEELRLEAFFNRKEPDLGPEARRKGADRLVERALIRREMSFSKYPEPSKEEVDAALEQFRKPHFPTEAALLQDLARRALTEDQMRRHMRDQLMFLRFLEVRFRPAVQVPDREIQSYYDRQFVPAWRKAHGNQPAPTLAASRDQIEQILTQLQVDRALDRWMGETRTQTRIRYREEVFR